ncbi:RDD family protein [Citricoccus sp. GCM10030269]|uniref:RDD family protein n=1 Tax=Citricoccus sp. GCM10030269 TaxID=3273388 RepID=UPI00361AF05E
MSATVVTGEAVVLQLRPASFVVRAAGALLDGLVLVLVFVGAGWALGATIFNELDEAAAQAVLLVLGIACLIGIPSAVETLSRGRSVGKLIFGLRVVRDDGGAVRSRHGLVRVLLGVFELWMTAGSVALIATMANERGKRLADMVAGTRVVIERQRKVPAPLPGVPASMQHWAEVADVGRLPDALVASVTQFLRHSSTVPPVTRQQTLQRLAAQVAPFVAPGPPAGVGLEDFLLAVVAERRNRDYRLLSRHHEIAEASADRLHTLPFT